MALPKRPEVDNIEGIHYVVGKKPPKSFRQPIIDPKDYEHVITFYNGSVAVIISQHRPCSSNSLTLSWLLVDEAKFIDYAKLKDETLPANGGIKSYFGKHSYNHSIMILSDMPQTQKGSYILHLRPLTRITGCENIVARRFACKELARIFSGSILRSDTFPSPRYHRQRRGRHRLPMGKVS